MIRALALVLALTAACPAFSAEDALARTKSTDSAGLVDARNRLSQCIERNAEQYFEDFAGRSGSAKYLARRLVALAAKRCASEAQSLRAMTPGGGYAEEFRDIIRFQTNDFAVQIEAERLSAI